MARGKGKNGGSGHGKKRPIERYEHTDKKRVNNPPVGLVNPETEPPIPTHKVYDFIEPVPSVKPGKDLDYDPHLDPQLVWAGKKEHASFEVPTVSLHVHETIDPRTIIEAVRKRNRNGYSFQPSLFERPEEKLPLHDAIASSLSSSTEERSTRHQVKVGRPWGFARSHRNCCASRW